MKLLLIISLISPLGGSVVAAARKVETKASADR